MMAAASIATRTQFRSTQLGKGTNARRNVATEGEAIPIRASNQITEPKAMIER